jgi:SMODS-associated and fused to various effectors sensor domain
MAMLETERRKLWVRAGGRCSLCKRYLLEGGLTSFEVPIGEGAHIVGQLNAPGSPRGLDNLDISLRDHADNVLLTCSNCHTEIDKAQVAKVMTTELLRERKKSHEDEIRHQTGLAADRRTAVLRVHGEVRGAAMNVAADATAVAVLQSSDRFPLFPASYDQQGLEIDLRHIPGEDPVTAAYYNSARAAIDNVVSGRLREGISRDDVDHLSVFAIARLPLLVYLGLALDDGVATDVYQRHRSTGQWTWPTHAPETTFSVGMSREGTADVPDAVLIINLSGTTRLSEVPSKLGNVPAFVLSAQTGSHEDIIASAGTLDALRGCFRRFFSDLEASHKHLDRLHIFGGMPVSAGVTLGQCLRARDLRPVVVLYDPAPDGYQQAMEI